MRRLIAAAVLLILTGGIGTPATCTGWARTASERMACCQRAQHHECDDQSAADDCCAQEEQARQNGATATWVTHAAVIQTDLADSPVEWESGTARQVASRLAVVLSTASSPSPPALSPPLRI